MKNYWLCRFAALLTIAIAVTCGVQTSADETPTDPQRNSSFEKEILVTVKVDYLLYLPQGYEAKPNWPLLVFLHGSGESGEDLEKVKVHGPPKLIKEGKSFPFIVVSPQARRRGGWNASAINALIDDVTQKHHVDADRIYVTGLSMGGYGTWSLAEAYPNKFAAIAPICGGGEVANAPKLKDLPIWVFHGTKDEAVPFKRSEEMVDALKAAGSTNVRFTVYPNVGHDSWTETYNNPELYEWLLSHKRKQ